MWSNLCKFLPSLCFTSKSLDSLLQHLWWDDLILDSVKCWSNRYGMSQRCLNGFTSREQMGLAIDLCLCYPGTADPLWPPEVRRWHAAGGDCRLYEGCVHLQGCPSSYWRMLQTDLSILVFSMSTHNICVCVVGPRAAIMESVWTERCPRCPPIPPITCLLLFPSHSLSHSFLNSIWSDLLFQWEMTKSEDE